MLYSLTFPLWAETADNILPKAPDPLSYAGKVMIFLVLIIGLIVVLAWLAGKMRGSRFVSSAGSIKVLATQSLGMKEKIAVIEVGEQQMVIGITAQQITLLSELADKLPVSEPAQPLSFQELLKKAVRS